MSTKALLVFLAVAVLVFGPVAFFFRRGWKRYRELVIVWVVTSVGMLAMSIGVGSLGYALGPTLAGSLFLACMVRSMKRSVDAIVSRSTPPTGSRWVMEGQPLASLLAMIFWFGPLRIAPVATGFTALAYLLVLYEAGYRWLSLRRRPTVSSSSG